jgi:cytochrome d ubiquinol oxidase subunit I
VWAIPLPWIAIEFGWIVAELGRQPWTIAGVLPTHLSSSSLQVNDLYLSIAGFVLFYTALFIIEIKLMFKYARLGPSSLHTGRYHHELAPAGERASV